jgi:hypothetical protein
VTALQGIDALGLRRGHTVLIFGAAGAVGTRWRFISRVSRGSCHRQAGREAHLAGPIAAALGEHASTLLAASPVIERIDVVAARLP